MTLRGSPAGQQHHGGDHQDEAREPGQDEGEALADAPGGGEQQDEGTVVQRPQGDRRADDEKVNDHRRRPCPGALRRRRARAPSGGVPQPPGRPWARPSAPASRRPATRSWLPSGRGPPTPGPRRRRVRVVTAPRIATHCDSVGPGPSSQAGAACRSPNAPSRNPPPECRGPDSAARIPQPIAVAHGPTSPAELGPNRLTGRPWRRRSPAALRPGTGAAGCGPAGVPWDGTHCWCRRRAG